MINHSIAQANQLLMSSTSSSAISLTASDQFPHRHSVATVRSSSSSTAPPLSINPRNKPSRSTTFNAASRTTSVDTAIDKKKSKKVPERGQSFTDKKLTGDDNYIDKQVYLDCISNLKESVEFLLQLNHGYTSEIDRLKEENLQLIQRRDIVRSSPVLPRPSNPSSRPHRQPRPHSMHTDIFESDEYNVTMETTKDHWNLKT
jgi:hypothetical protein